MIHNVGSYDTRTTGQEHNLSNCVHKHSGNRLDTDADMKSAGQAANTQPAGTEVSLFDGVSSGIKKLLGNGIGLLRGIWNTSGETGNDKQNTGVEKGADLQNGHGTVTTVGVSLQAIESVADMKTPIKRNESAQPEKWKLSAAVPTLKIKTGLARERFEARKDAFLKRMKEMAKSRQKDSFEENKEERPGQQEKEMEWFEMSNAHLLDSYNKNGEYTNLGNRIDGQGYSGSPIKENYSKKA